MPACSVSSTGSSSAAVSSSSTATSTPENFKTRIDVLELEETLAVVRVLEEGWGGKIDFTDVLLLLKIDGEWKCVAKAYNQNSNTVEK